MKFRKKREEISVANFISSPSSSTITPTMDSSLKREFELFKMRKILKRSYLTLLQPTLKPEEAKTLLDQVKTYGFGGVLTLPAAIPSFSRLLDGEKPLLYTAISYPHGEDLTKTKISAAKNCLSVGAKGIVCVLSLSPVKRGEWKQVRKEGEKLTSAFGKKTNVKIAVDLACLSEQEQEKLFRCCKGAKIKSFVLFSSSGLLSPLEIRRIKEFCSVPIEVMGGLDSSAELLEFLEGGAEGVFSSQMLKATENLAESYNVTARELQQEEI
ncbi:MAG: hypothetical protein IIY09_02970 [Clostridia bacterium]|nr:hypothetical protein [Clostridia bacterium]